MRLFDFDKFSRSAWVGSRHNVAWRKYDVVTTDDSANAAVEAHRFLQRSHDKGEQCLCGWAGDCWADHFEAQVVPAPEPIVAEEPAAPAEEVTDTTPADEVVEEAPKPKRRRKKPATEDADEAVEVSPESPSVEETE